MAEKKKKKSKKAEKKSQKSEKKAAKKEKKKARKYSKKVVLFDALSEAAKKAIKAADAAELNAADATEKFQIALNNLRTHIGSPTFEHPDRGPMSIMNRGDLFFWRKSPDGK